MKGYLLFVEGESAPKVVHSSDRTALKEGQRLAKKFPDREVILLQVVKRLRATAAGEVASIGSHLPKITTSELVPNPKRRPLLTLNKAVKGESNAARS